MATPADQRLLELLDKWLESLALHTRYTGLDSDSYWKIQPWPEHQRPSRWIIDLATQKATALQAEVKQRIKQGDARFSDALELMTFLANLIGSEHIERFIPLADRANERNLRAEAAATPERDGSSGGATGTRQMPAFQAAPASEPAVQAPEPGAAPPTPAASSASGTTTVTREMPRLAAGKRSGSKPPATGAPDSPTATREMPQLLHQKRRAAAPVGTTQVARTERRPAEHKPPPKTPARQPARIAAPSDADTARDRVIADAVRLVQWGRKWYELAELIARMADRPPLSEVRRILKDNKTAIDKKAGGR
jgi:hypothetical protein